MNEEESLKEQYESIWERIMIIAQDIKKIDELIYEPKKDIKNDNKDIFILKKRLKELEELRKVKELKWKEEFDKYMEQQSQIAILKPA